MLATSSELQTLAPLLDDLEQVRLLRHRAAGEPFPHSFIHEADAYSAAPADLTRGLDHAPGTNQGQGKGMAWYFCSPANCHASAGGGSARRRRRQVGDGGGAGSGAGAGKTCWHPEKGEKLILGPDKKSVGAYKRTLSYVSKIKNPPGTAKPFKNKRLGWCMTEIWLEKQDDGADQQLVLCKVYRSPRTDPETSMEASPTVAEDVRLAAVRTALLRMIDDLGSIVSGSLDELEQVLKGVGMMEELSWNKFLKALEWESYDVNTCGRGGSDLAATTIHRELGSREIQASNVLRSIDVKVQMILQGLLSEVMKVSLVVDDSEAEDCVRALHSAFFENGFVSEVDGAENECPIPENSSAAAASSGVKRKAAEDHPESPPSVRQGRTGTERSVLQETERTSLSGTDPMPVGDSDDNVGDPSEFFQSILNDVEMEPDKGDDGGDWAHELVLTEVADDGSGPRKALDEIVRNLFSENDLMPVRGDDGGDLARYLAGIVEGDDNLDGRGDLPSSTTVGICPSESTAA